MRQEIFDFSATVQIDDGDMQDSSSVAPYAQREIGDVSSGGATESSLAISNKPRLTVIEANTANDFEIIAEYEHIVQRSMNVREYVLYINDLRVKKQQSSTALSEYIEDLFRTQNGQFNLAKDTMHMYLEKYLTEESFIAQCLPRVHADSSYLKVLRKEIINSQEYKDKMIERLQDIYASLYGEEMGRSDVEFLFERIKVNELALTSDTLTESVASFKVETDELLQHIFDVFFDVLDREPDGVEQLSYMAVVRRMSDTSKESIEEKISVELKESLEYHDILKRKIAKAYAKHNRDTLFPSKMYGLLQKVLPYRLSKSIDNLIERAVQDLGDI